MDHVAGMRVGHRLADLLENPQKPRQVVRRRCPRSQQLGQGPALDQLHREVRAAVAESPQLVDRHDARMLKLAGDLRFLDEPAHQVGVFLVRFEQHLHGEVATQVGVAALEYDPHAPPGDLT